jgi:hypothetical protein
MAYSRLRKSGKAGLRRATLCGGYLEKRGRETIVNKTKKDNPVKVVFREVKATRGDVKGYL